MRSSPEETFSEQPFIMFVQPVINRSMPFGSASNFQEWRYSWEEQIREGLFRCRLSWGVNLSAAERTGFLLQPDGAMAFAAPLLRKEKGACPEGNRYTGTGRACEKWAPQKQPLRSTK